MAVIDRLAFGWQFYDGFFDLEEMQPALNIAQFSEMCRLFSH